MNDYDWRDFKARHGGIEGARAAFETFCESLLREIHADVDVHVVRADPGDEGIDICIGDFGHEDIVVCQCKFFLETLGHSQKDQIRRSFGRATNSDEFRMEKWVLCLPKTLNVDELKWWSKFKHKFTTHELKLQLMDGDELLVEAKKHGLVDVWFRHKGTTIPPPELQEIELPAAAIRRWEAERFPTLDLLNQAVSWEGHHCELPLLFQIPPDRLLPKDDENHAGEPGKTNQVAISLHSWEEQVKRRNDRLAQPASLDDIFSPQYGDIVSTDRATDDAAAVPRLVVLGPPGAGKTTLWQDLIRRMEDGTWPNLGRPLVPAVVRLREWHSNTELRGLDLIGFLVKRHADRMFGTDEQRRRQWQAWLRRGDVLLLIDGLDEIPPAGLVADAIKAALLEFSSPSRPNPCAALLTCRTVTFEQYQTVCPNFDVFMIGDLTGDSRERFITNFPCRTFDAGEMIAELERLPQMEPLTRNPLLLAILCWVVNDLAPPNKEIVLPATRSELFDRAIDKFLDQPPRVTIDHPTVKMLKAGSKRRQLEHLAFRLFTRGGCRLYASEEFKSPLHEVTGELKNLTTDGLVDAFVEDLTQNSGIVRGDESQGFFFLHNSVQEFLAASYLARLVNRKKSSRMAGSMITQAASYLLRLVCGKRGRGWDAKVEVGGRVCSVWSLINRKAWAPTWHEVVCLMAGLLHEPAPLLELLADDRVDDYFRHRLGLAALCLAELRDSTFERCGNVAERISTAAFHFWWYQRSITGTDTSVSHLTRVMSALGQFDARVDGTSVLTLLYDRLNHATAIVRFRAAEALAAMPERTAANPTICVRLLGRLYEFSDSSGSAERVVRTVRRIIVEAARRHDEVLTALSAAFQRGQPLSADLIDDVGPAAARNPDMIPALLAHALTDPFPTSVRLALGKMRDNVVRHPQVRSMLLDALRADVAPESEFELIAEQVFGIRLTSTNASDNYYMRASAVELLGFFEYDFECDTQLLFALFDVALDEASTPFGFGSRAASTLASLISGKPCAHPFLNKLARLVTQGGVDERRRAIGVVSQMGAIAGDHREMLSALEGAADDPDPDLRLAAQLARERINEVGKLKERTPKKVGVSVLGSRSRLSARDASKHVRGDAEVPSHQLKAALISAVKERYRYSKRGQARINELVHISAEDAMTHPAAISALVGVFYPFHRLQRLLHPLRRMLVGYYAMDAVLQSSDNWIRFVKGPLVGIRAAFARFSDSPALAIALRNGNANLLFAAGKALSCMGETAVIKSGYPDLLPELTLYIPGDEKWMKDCTGQSADVLSGLSALERDCSRMLNVTRDLEGIGEAVRRSKYSTWLRGRRDHSGFFAAPDLVEALGRIGVNVTKSPVVIRVLADALAHNCGVIRTAAAEAWGQLMSVGIRVFPAGRGKWKARTVAELTGNNSLSRYRDPQTGS